MPPFKNPADYYMNILAINYPKSEKDTKKIDYLKKKYDELLKDNIVAQNKNY